MLLSSPNSSSRSAVSLHSLHQFLCKVLRYTLTICATVAALSLHSRPKQAALASSLPLITLFSCVYCFFAQRRRRRSLLLLTCPVQLTGALLFLHLHSLTLPPHPPFICTTSLRTDVAGSAAVYYAATHPQCGSGCAGRGSAPDNEFLVCATGRRSCRCCCRRRRWQCLLSLQIFEFDS